MQVTQRARRKAMQNIETEGRKSIDIMLRPTSLTACRIIKNIEFI